MLFRTTIVLFVGFVLSTASALALNNRFVEGETTRGGECIEYRKLFYDVDQGGGSFVTKVKVLERKCGSDGCFTEVYNGPESGYNGDIYTPPNAGLPFSIGAGGYGYVTVPSGDGGMLAPDSSPTCDVTFTADYSTTVVIHPDLLVGIYIE